MRYRYRCEAFGKEVTLYFKSSQVFCNCKRTPPPKQMVVVSESKRELIRKEVD